MRQAEKSPPRNKTRTPRLSRRLRVARKVVEEYANDLREIISKMKKRFH